jgi:hypothetical protein
MSRFVDLLSKEIQQENDCSPADVQAEEVRELLALFQS